MLSLRSRAFILASASRRARALSSAALQCFPHIIIGRKIAVKTATKIATRMVIVMAHASKKSLHLFSYLMHRSHRSTPRDQQLMASMSSFLFLACALTNF